MLKVEFNSLDEFLGELAQDTEHVQRGIVRATFERTPRPQKPTSFTVIAGYVAEWIDEVNADRSKECIVELRLLVGSAMEAIEVASISERMNETMDEIRAATEDHGLELRHGNIVTA